MNTLILLLVIFLVLVSRLVKKGKASPLWTPDELHGVVCWYDFSDPKTHAITGFKDKSGNENDLVFPCPIHRPKII